VDEKRHVGFVSCRPARNGVSRRSAGGLDTLAGWTYIGDLKCYTPFCMNAHLLLILR
jgi:hypothetical protein